MSGLSLDPDLGVVEHWGGWWVGVQSKAGVHLSVLLGPGKSYLIRVGSLESTAAVSFRVHGMIISKLLPDNFKQIETRCEGVCLCYLMRAQ